MGIPKAAVLLCMLLAVVVADSCGGNCANTACPNCICGIKPNKQSIEGWCAKYSWSQSCCRCIMAY